MDDPDPIRPAAAPPWLRPDIQTAMRGAYDRKLAVGGDPAVAVAAACAVLLAQVTQSEQPLDDARAPDAAAVVPLCAPPSDHAPSPGTGVRLVNDANVADLVAALSYALRFDARGKPRRGGWDHAADLAAEWIAEHLRRSNFVITKQPPGSPHSAG